MSLCDRCKNKCKFMLKNKTLDTCSLFEKQTNFDRITASPEALAEFITGLIGIGKCSWCIDGGNPDACPCDFEKQCLFEGEGCLEWLNEESKE